MKSTQLLYSSTRVRKKKLKFIYICIVESGKNGAWKNPVVILFGIESNGVLARAT